MATTSSSPAASAVDAAPAFGRIVCAIDGSRADPECVAQAALLAGPSGSIRLMAVTWTVGTGPGEMAALGESRAKQALESARRLALELGVPASRELIRDDDAAAALIRHSAGGELLVVGGHGASRVEGIVLGSTATAIVHRSPSPVLVARRPPPGIAFPARILLASDGSDGSRRAARLAAAVARAHRAVVVMVNVARSVPSDVRHALAEEAALLVEATGREPVLVSEPGRAHELLPELADRHAASLLVIGSRGRAGVKALGSVSERVAHRAPCSVLIARPGP